MKLRIHDKTRTAIKADGTRIPVKDGRHSFLVTPSQEDIKAGIPGDPARCMYAVNIRRTHGSELAWVTRTLAYIELRGRGGKSELCRYLIEEPARENIEDFDAGCEVTPESVIFAAPHGTRTLDGMQKSYQRYKEKRRAAGNPITHKRKAHVKGQLGKPSKIPFSLRDPQTGMFQFHR